MRLFSSALLALITATAPVFSAKIANPLTIDLVTSWGEGVIAGYSLWDLTTNRARVDEGIYQRVESFGPFEKEVSGVNFGVQRNVEDDHYYIVSFSPIYLPESNSLALVYRLRHRRSGGLRRLLGH